VRLKLPRTFQGASTVKMFYASQYFEPELDGTWLLTNVNKYFAKLLLLFAQKPPFRHCDNVLKIHELCAHCSSVSCKVIKSLFLGKVNLIYIARF